MVENKIDFEKLLDPYYDIIRNFPDEKVRRITGYFDIFEDMKFIFGQSKLQLDDIKNELVYFKNNNFYTFTFDIEKDSNQIIVNILNSFGEIITPAINIQQAILNVIIYKTPHPLTVDEKVEFFKTKLNLPGVYVELIHFTLMDVLSYFYSKENNLEYKLVKSNSNNEEIALNVLKSIRPSTYYINNTKIANNLTRSGEKDMYNGANIIVMNDKKNKPITTYCLLSYEEDNLSITGKQKFTEYDRVVHNAVCTLCEAGNTTLTPSMIFRTIKGDNKTEPTPAQKGSITKSLEKSRYTKLTIDFTDEANAKGWNVSKTTKDDMMLSAEKITVKIGGQTAEAYKINKTPILYEYAKLTKQIISVPINTLYIGKVAQDTETNIILKEYLLKRIEIMRKNTNQSQKIIYDTIFDECGIEYNTRQMKLKYVNTIKAILSLWENDKFIKNFTEYKEGKTTKGITINF